ncbi:hypothetical protein ACVDFE_23045 [Lentzea chajnantorensis]
MSWADYGNSAACGTYVLVKAANGKSVTVRVTDLCPGRWRQLPRAGYNCFLAENGCGGPVAVTDLYGERFVLPALPVRPDVVQPTEEQFSAH